MSTNNIIVASTSSAQQVINQNKLNKQRILTNKPYNFENDACYSLANTLSENNGVTDKETWRRNERRTTSTETTISTNVSLTCAKNKIQTAKFFPISTSRALAIIIFLIVYSATFLLYAQKHTVILLIMTGFYFFLY